MEFEKNIETGCLVVKHNDLINATSDYKFEKNELKLICHLIAHINNKEEKDFITKNINLRELNFSEEDITNVKYITDLCVSIMSKPFKIGKGVYNWFSALEYEDGVIQYRFDPALKPFLLDLKDNFTKYKLENILTLRSNYSIQVFELLTQYKTIGSRTMTIEEFRNILSIPNTYKNNDLKRLLETIQKDLKSHSNIEFLFEIEKVGRKFDKIKFSVMKGKNKFLRNNENKFN